MTHCPICNGVMVPAYRPFCSKRCADIDLAHWLRGDYVIPGDEVHSEQTETEDKE